MKTRDNPVQTADTGSGGFTLIEILVSLVVLSIGLLGLAALQTTGLKNNQSAYYRSLATNLAYDIADRIRANKTAEQAGSYGIALVTAPNASTINCTTGATCTAGQMATYDLSHFKCSLGNFDTNSICANTLSVQGDLPLGDGSVSESGLGVYTVTVMWDDERRGVTGTGCGGDPAVDLTCFSMEFRP